ncbi:hypothetical protein BDM02DRAFT_3111993 [Thelephora ganbajun]|uniref:Uncharacterized protein n=1 Tax=Thelephora ganbajun TaxID=370292 RepID=A0ACB6ZM57_THEGA|nr:hypothetical protein BDM02DRAFT_3111993 [Thelephora ganbajun]
MAHPENCRHVGTSRHGDSPILRKISSWAALGPRTPVDLYNLCISYQNIGAMGLPRDIIERIIRFLHKDIRTLKACSLTCRAFFSAVRRLIHRRVRLVTWKSYCPFKLVDRIAAKVLRGRKVHEAHMRHLSTAGKCGLFGYARELLINIGPSFAPETLEVYLPYFRSFSQVQTLRICRFNLTSFLPTFERCFTQFVPTLRSLHLPDVVGDVHEVLEFICKFPRLDDLSLTLCLSHCAGVPPRPCMECSPPLKGKLILRGWGSASARFLLEIPGGLHFRSVDAGGVDKAELDQILVACSSTLEVFSLCPRSLLDTADLSRNLALKRFEVRVDPDDLTLIPPLLHDTLSTVSSPVFSEFILKLEGYPTENRFFHLLSSRVVWGDEWGIIDRDLSDMVRRIGRDIRLAVWVTHNGGVWSRELGEFVGGMFPLMNARGLVRVLKPGIEFDEGERFIW